MVKRRWRKTYDGDTEERKGVGPPICSNKSQSISIKSGLPFLLIRRFRLDSPFDSFSPCLRVSLAGVVPLYSPSSVLRSRTSCPR